MPAEVGAVRGSVAIGLLLVGWAALGADAAPVAGRVVRLTGQAEGWYEADSLAALPVRAWAAVPKDGEEVVVDGGWGHPVRPWPAPSWRPVVTGAPALVSLNHAPASELEGLPRVGPVLARRIVAGRPYRRLDDLLRVAGIGPATLEQLRPRVRL